MVEDRHPVALFQAGGGVKGRWLPGGRDECRRPLGIDRTRGDPVSLQGGAGDDAVGHREDPGHRLGGHTRADHHGRLGHGVVHSGDVVGGCRLSGGAAGDDEDVRPATVKRVAGGILQRERREGRHA